MDVVSRWHTNAHLLAANRDVLAPLATSSAALDERGWAAFLRALDDAQLDALEASALEDGALPSDAPPSLRALHAEALRAAALPTLLRTEPSVPRRRESPRKQAQVDGLSALLAPLARQARRVVDVGCGHGHLTRHIASATEAPVVGLERDPARAAVAQALAGTACAFATLDVVGDPAALREGDCVVGLHACGELGDAVVARAAAVASSIALVGCCLQKRRAEVRAALCTGDVDVAFPRAWLGLSNLTARDDGVEASRSANLAARRARLAVWRLLQDAGVDVARGAELAGLNRRAAHAPFSQLVARVFAARGLTAPASCDDALRFAHETHARERRLALPRQWLARPLEVFIALDRARHLVEHGFAVSVGELFPAAVSARNVAIAATR